MNNRDDRPLIRRAVVEEGARRRADIEQWGLDYCAVEDDIRNLESVSPLDEISNNQLQNLQFKRDNLMRDKQGKQFYEQPRELFESLADYIRQQIALYEKAFPAGQSPHVQLCLYQMEAHLCFMERVRREINLFQERNLYFALCGMMWSILDKVDNPHDQPLAQTILHVLCEHRMHKQDSLNEYAYFCKDYAHQIPNVDLPNVSHYLKCRFNYVMRQLEAELTSARYRHTDALVDLKKKARGVMTEIVALEFDCGLFKKPFDYKLYSSIFAKTQQLMVNPGNGELKADYEYLMSLNKQGASSPQQMIVGAMLVFAGALTVAATFVCEAVSVCTSSAVTFPLKAAGFATMIVGATLFGSSRSHGTTSATKDFRQEVDRCEDRQRQTERSPLLAGVRH